MWSADADFHDPVTVFEAFIEDQTIKWEKSRLKGTVSNFNYLEEISFFALLVKQ